MSIQYKYVSIKIGGIPCFAKILEWTKEEPYDHFDEGSPEFIDFEIVDRRKASAPWLEIKVERGNLWDSLTEEVSKKLEMGDYHVE